MARKASTMSDSANIDLVNESTEDSLSLGTGGTGKPIYCTEC